MPTPLAHGLMGAAIIAATQRNRDDCFHWRGYLMGFALAAAPDLDCLFHWLPFAPFA